MIVWLIGSLVFNANLSSISAISCCEQILQINFQNRSKTLKKTNIKIIGMKREKETYNCLCNQYLSPLMLWVRISIRVRCTTLCNNVCQWLVTGQWFSPGRPVSSTNKTDRHDITEILWRWTPSNKQTNKHINKQW